MGRRTSRAETTRWQQKKENKKSMCEYIVYIYIYIKERNNRREEEHPIILDCSIGFDRRSKPFDSHFDSDFHPYASQPRLFVSSKAGKWSWYVIIYRVSFFYPLFSLTWLLITSKYLTLCISKYILYISALCWMCITFFLKCDANQLNYCVWWLILFDSVFLATVS